MLSQQRPRGGARLCVPVGPQWAAVPAPLSPRGQAGRLECRCAGMNLNEGRYCQSVMAELECVLAVYCMVDMCCPGACSLAGSAWPHGKNRKVPCRGLTNRWRLRCFCDWNSAAESVQSSQLERSHPSAKSLQNASSSARRGRVRTVPRRSQHDAAARGAIRDVIPESSKAWRPRTGSDGNGRPAVGERAPRAGVPPPHRSGARS